MLFATGIIHILSRNAVFVVAMIVAVFDTTGIAIATAIAAAIVTAVVAVLKNPSKCLRMRLFHHIDAAMHAFERQTLHNAALHDRGECILLYIHQPTNLLLSLSADARDPDALAEIFDVAAESLQLGGVAVGCLNEGVQGGLVDEGQM
jgi:hypothetical protein